MVLLPVYSITRVLPGCSGLDWGFILRHDAWIWLWLLGTGITLAVVNGGNLSFGLDVLWILVAQGMQMLENGTSRLGRRLWLTAMPLLLLLSLVVSNAYLSVVTS